MFQGDIFRGVPTAFLGHPAARATAFAMEPSPSAEAAEQPLTHEEIRDVAGIAGSYTMVLPHPCDFSAGEKGETHTVRQVARLVALSQWSAVSRSTAASTRSNLSNPRPFRAMSAGGSGSS